ncbi:hypothetical protein [Siphonobacter sp. SORGH_AS_0500]|uniref:hypothetical protein n=1 Tax=Siphonobacter sp. SORGH_AS_0500 TaxID=1864824 RepID=UPI0018E34F8B|nr:hypothetical protein [Siphonobacter sp. SORGH_AS_0500]
MNERLRGQYLIIVSLLFALILNFPLLSLLTDPSSGSAFPCSTGICLSYGWGW